MNRSGTPVAFERSLSDLAFGKSLFHCFVYCDFLVFTPLFVLKPTYALRLFDGSTLNLAISLARWSFFVLESPRKYLGGQKGLFFLSVFFAISCSGSRNGLPVCLTKARWLSCHGSQSRDARQVQKGQVYWIYGPRIFKGKRSAASQQWTLCPRTQIQWHGKREGLEAR